MHSIRKIYTPIRVKRPMKKTILILLALIALLTLCGTVSAYYLTLEAPKEIQVGMPLIITGSTNLPAGTSTDMTFSLVEYTQTQIDKQPVTIQGDKNFKVKFETAGLKKGTYKIELLASRELSSDSQTMKVVQLIDRSDEVQLTSSQKQDFTGSLILAGTAPKNGDAGIQIQVSNENGDTIYGPEFIPTTKEGVFSKKIPIPSAGKYDVTFSDGKGLIGTFLFTSIKAVTIVPTVTSITPVDTQPVPGENTLSASSFASREKPAYFSVTPRKGPVKIYTSTGTDWVIEYSADKSNVVKVNDYGSTSPEKVQIDGNGEPVAFKIYPYYGEGTVTLYGDNVEKIRLDESLSGQFGSSTRVPTPTTTKSPLSVVSLLFACTVSIMIAVWKGKKE